MEDLKWSGVLGSLVLAEQKPRTLGTAAASSKIRGEGGCVSFLLQEGERRLLWFVSVWERTSCQRGKRPLCVFVWGFSRFLVNGGVAACSVFLPKREEGAAAWSGSLDEGVLAF
ncbi:hypothetical protein BDE02_01G206400 [Populus trichocarpa]|nr:hypothetical protein BDE02_01G206400 [Populus trichocarpa]